MARKIKPKNQNKKTNDIYSLINKVYGNNPNIAIKSIRDGLKLRDLIVTKKELIGKSEEK